MAIKIFVDNTTLQSVMYDDVEEYAFGPVFGSDEDPAYFLEWAEAEMIFPQYDITKLKPHVLSDLVDKWRKEVKENSNEERAERYYSDTEATTLTEICDNARRI